VTAQGQQLEPEKLTFELIIGYCAVDEERQNSQRQAAERETVC